MAKLYGTRIGAFLVVLGLSGLAFPHAITRLGIPPDPRLGAAYLLSGSILMAAGTAGIAVRLVAQVSGMGYTLVAVIGLIDGATVLGWFPVTLLSNVMHLVIGLLGQYAGFGRRSL